MKTFISSILFVMISTISVSASADGKCPVYVTTGEPIDMVVEGVDGIHKSEADGILGYKYDMRQDRIKDMGAGTWQTIKSIKPLGPANEPTGFTVTWYEVDPADNSVSVMYIKDDAATDKYLLTSSFHLPSGHKVIVTSELDKHIEDCE